jgi:hypothetical protein
MFDYKSIFPYPLPGIINPFNDYSKIDLSVYLPPLKNPYIIDNEPSLICTLQRAKEKLRYFFDHIPKDFESVDDYWANDDMKNSCWRVNSSKIDQVLYQYKFDYTTYINRIHCQEEYKANPNGIAFNSIRKPYHLDRITELRIATLITLCYIEYYIADNYVGDETIVSSEEYIKEIQGLFSILRCIEYKGFDQNYIYPNEFGNI